MQESYVDHISNAVECVSRIESMLEKVDPTKIKPLTTAVEEILQHLKKASQAAFQQHVHFALSPDCFNPFNLAEVDRSYSRFALDEPNRTLMLLKVVMDRNHEEESKPAGERMSDLIVVYTISSDLETKSFVLHNLGALTSYQDDEADARKTGGDPLIANHGVRRRLLAAKTPPPGELDLEKVARVVEHALGRRTKNADVHVRTWYCQSVKYTLDIVSVWSLIQARRRILEVPGVGERKDLIEEDTLSRYFSVEETLDENR